MTRPSRYGATLAIAGSLIGAGCYGGLDGAASAGAEDGADGADGAEGADGADDADGADGADDDGADDGDDGPNADGGDPGRVTLHRLNRTEYNNTMRDLFWGLDISPADGFPADDHSLGFDNIADVLSVTPVLFELYERAADSSVAAALAAETSGEAVRAEAESGTATIGSACCGGFWNLSSNGTITSNITVEASGDYNVVVRAAQQAGGPDAAHMVVLVDGMQLGEFDVTATEAAPADYELSTTLTEGSHSVVVEFTNDYYDAGAGEDLNLLVDYVDLVPAGGGGPGSPVRDLLIPCDPAADGNAACAREVVEAFLPRAWRRPTTVAEVDALLEVFAGAEAEGADFEEAIATTLKGALVSPHFIFRVELDPDPTSLVPHALGDYEIASRLSYFLWSSMPDDALFERAAAGELTNADVIAEEVQRMLGDDRAAALVQNFFGQWLWVRALQDPLTKDYEQFPEFDTDLQASMEMETQLFLNTFLTEGRSIRDILLAEETFVDAPLATLYGVPMPPAAEQDENGFARVAFDGAPRRGLLTQGGLMSILSHPNVTSPVRRGKWVLEQLLCRPPPPPPPGVEAEPLEPAEGGTMREQLEQHRADPACAACHDNMDPLGLALEHYDAIGRWRDQDAGMEIITDGTLPDGTPFTTALDMASKISESNDYTLCTVRKTMTYAIGRDVGPSDVQYIEEIIADFVADEMSLESLLIGVATNATFTMRRGEDE